MYRLAIRSRIARNNSDATIDGIAEALGFIAEREVLRVVDNQDMTFTVNFADPVSPEFQELALALDIIPRPQGVRFGGFIIPQESPVFSFAEENGTGILTQAAGFGEIEPYALAVDDDGALADGSEGIFTVTEPEQELTGDPPQGGNFAELFEVA